jgi:hypothetical protein
LKVFQCARNGRAKGAKANTIDFPEVIRQRSTERVAALAGADSGEQAGTGDEQVGLWQRFRTRVFLERLRIA